MKIVKNYDCCRCIYGHGVVYNKVLKEKILLFLIAYLKALISNFIEHLQNCRTNSVHTLGFCFCYVILLSQNLYDGNNDVYPDFIWLILASSKIERKVFIIVGIVLYLCYVDLKILSVISFSFYTNDF